MKKFFRAFILTLAIGAIIYGTYNISTTLWGYYKAKKAHEELASSVITDNIEYNTKKETKKNPMEVYKKEYGTPPDINWDELLAKNSDVAGWIWIPHVGISYPVMYSKTPQYYLRKDINKQWLLNGSIFIDHQNKKDFSSVNTIVYGHNMTDGSMFGKMNRFINPDNYPFNPYVWILTPHGNYVYKMFTCFVEDPVGEAYLLFDKNESDPAQFNDWIKKVVSRSKIPFGEPEDEITLDSHIITLSSCYKDNRYRQISMCYRVFYDLKK